MDFYYDSKSKVKGDVISHEEFMNFEHDTYDVLGSVFLRELNSIKKTTENKVLEEKNRFDIISYKHFKTSDYWWVIMEFNDFIEFNINIGDMYKLPNIIDINKLIQKMIVKRNYSKLR